MKNKVLLLLLVISQIIIAQEEMIDIKGITSPTNNSAVPFFMNCSDSSDRVFVYKSTLYSDDSTYLSIFDLEKGCVYRERRIELKSIHVDFDRMALFGDTLIVYPRFLLGPYLLFDLSKESISKKKLFFYSKRSYLNKKEDEFKSILVNNVLDRNGFEQGSTITTKSFEVVWDQNQIYCQKKLQ